MQTETFTYDARGLRITLTRKLVADRWVFTTFSTVDIEGKILFFDAAAESPESLRQTIAELIGAEKI